MGHTFQLFHTLTLDTFLEKDEIVFHLAAISQCEMSEGHIWDSAYAF
jgi:hypothetical protein